MRRLTRWAFRFAVLVAALLAAAWFGRDMIFQRLNEEIRVRVQTMLAERHPNLHVQVRSAWLVEGEGIVLRGVTASPRYGTAAEPMIKVDELFCACGTQMPQFLTEKPQVHHVEFRGLSVRASRGGDGAWNLASLLPLPASEGRPPTIEIRDGAIEIVDAGQRPLLLRDIAVSITPQFPVGASGPSMHNGRLPLQIRGSLASEYCRQADFDGTFWPDEQAWSVRGTVAHFDFSRRLLAALPPEIADQLEPLASLDVQADMSYEVKSPLEPSGPIRFHLTSRLLDGRIDDPRFPYALTNLRGDIDVDNTGLRFRNLTASTGATQLQMSCVIAGFADDSPIQLQASARNLTLDQRVLSMLPEPAREQWEKYSPSGIVNIDAALEFDGHRWKPEMHAECVDVAVVYHKFPYRVDHGVGKLHYVNGRLWSEQLIVEANGQRIDVGLDIQQPGPDFTGWFEARAHGPIPLDNELISALEDKPEEIVRSLQPAGSIVVERMRIDRVSPDQEPTKRLAIELRECSMKYEKFPYPIYKIHGRLVAEDNHWTFRDLIGQNDSGYIICKGQWQPKPEGGSLLTLDFDCRSVPLEDELREALKPAARQIWNKLQPRGSLDQLSVSVRYDSEPKDLSLDIRAQKWPPAQNVEGRSITIQPAWFPYRLDEVTGSVHVRDGVVELEQLRARHGRTSIDLVGQVSHQNDAWSFQIAKFMATQVEMDRDLLQALPPQLGGSLAKLNLVGPLTVSGRLKFAGNNTAADSATSDWELLIDAENGRLVGGLPLQNIRGGVHLFGHKDTQQFYSRGELAIDSVMLQGVQLTQVRGPLWIDQSGVLFGSWVPAPAPRAIPRNVTAQAFGGSVAFDARVANQPDARWNIEARVNDASLAEVSRDLSSRPSTVSGRVFGQLRLAGNNQGSHSWRGNGAVRLTDADIYELPQMIALLKLLVIEPPDTNAFTNSDMDFRIEGDRIYFDRINFNGNAISLKGRGEMSFQRDLNMNFYALVGRDEIWPTFLRAIRSETAKSLLLIQVAGTLDDPKLSRKAFPHVEETLQQLFPEATREPLPSPTPSTSWQSLDPRRLLR